MRKSIMKACSWRFTVILLMLTALSTDVAAQQSASVLERIKHSLPRNDVGWRITEADEPCRLKNGLTQAGFVWTKGEEEVRATAILYKNSRSVIKHFRHTAKGESSMEGFRVDGIGDEAYLFPPIILNQEGPFNLWFRKDQVEITMSTNSKATLERCAKYIIEAITSPGKGLPAQAAEPRR